MRIRTVEEVIKKLNAKDSLLRVNMRDSQADADIPVLKDAIITTAKELIKEIANAQDLHSAMVLVCSNLHTMYSLGKVVGMEMEKQTLEEKEEN